MTRIGLGPYNYQMAHRPFPISQIKSTVICHDNICLCVQADETFLIQFLYGFHLTTRMHRCRYPVGSAPTIDEFEVFAWLLWQVLRQDCIDVRR